VVAASHGKRKSAQSRASYFLAGSFAAAWTRASASELSSLRSARCVAPRSARSPWGSISKPNRRSSVRLSTRSTRRCSATHVDWTTPNAWGSHEKLWPSRMARRCSSDPDLSWRPSNRYPTESHTLGHAQLSLKGRRVVRRHNVTKGNAAS